MKKYLLTSAISLTLSIALLVHLYKTKDIEWVDAIIETSAKRIGIVPRMVSEKVERKIRQKRLAESVVTPALPDLAQEVIATPDHDNIDSAVVEAPVKVNEKRTRTKLFNGDNTPAPVIAEVQVDSVVVLPVVEAPKPVKKKLFNAGVDKSESAPVKTIPSEQVVYFKAEVNTPQRFGDDQEITFRTSETVKIGEATIPEKVVFQAKANVFDGRIHFIVKSIHNVAVKGENFKEEQPGMPIGADVRLDKSYFLSEGYPVLFGVRL